jgi:hypothetical protein
VLLDNEKKLITCSVLPDGCGGFQPCPELLTEAEAIRFLRLDEEGGPSDPSLTLRYYREKKVLMSTHISKTIKYSRRELERFIEKLTY